MKKKPKIVENGRNGVKINHIKRLRLVFKKKRVRFGGWWPLVASKTVYYYLFLLQKFWGCWDSGTFMIYQALFSFLLTFSRVFSTMRKDQLRVLVLWRNGWNTQNPFSFLDFLINFRFWLDFIKNIKKILDISKTIRAFESPYYVFGNLSVLSIYSEVLGLVKQLPQCGSKSFWSCIFFDFVFTRFFF